MQHKYSILILRIFFKILLFELDINTYIKNENENENEKVFSQIHVLECQ